MLVFILFAYAAPLSEFPDNLYLPFLFTPPRKRIPSSVQPPLSKNSVYFCNLRGLAYAQPEIIVLGIAELLTVPSKPDR